MLPGAFAQLMPYQTHNDGYRLVFGTEPGFFSDNLSCAQYTELLKFSPQLAALDQKLDFFTYALQRVFMPPIHPEQSACQWFAFLNFLPCILLVHCSFWW
jgi:hypothetical protein